MEISLTKDKPYGRIGGGGEAMEISVKVTIRGSEYYIDGEVGDSLANIAQYGVKS